MKKQYRILIADAEDTFAPLFASDICKSGCWAVIRRQERETLIRAVRSEHPDLAVLNPTQPTLDFCSLVPELRSISSLHILALYRQESPFMEAILRQDGVFCWKMPDQIRDLTDAVLRQFFQMQPDTEPMTAEQYLELDVTALLHAAGVPPRLQCFHFLRSAIIQFFRTPPSTRVTMQTIYPMIAAEYNCTPASVERSIRLAITRAWEAARPRHSCGLSVSGRGNPPPDQFRIRLACHRLAAPQGKEQKGQPFLMPPHPSGFSVQTS